MEVLGHGIDTISVLKVAQLLKRNSEFLYGWFSAGEIAELETGSANAQTVAGRVVAKEAIVKALGTGFDDSVSWQDVEVFRTPNGEPEVVLSGGAKEAATQKGVTKVFVSLSHTAEHAVASAILLG